MSLHPQAIQPVPPETSRVARAAFPKGNIYMTMRDELGTIYRDQDFADLFALEGQPAYCPWRLALICVMQFVAGLSDRQAAEAVRSRIDWKYALSLELSDPGFDFSILSEFRQRLLGGRAEQRLLDKLLERCQEKGWVKARGKQRSDSTHVVGVIRLLNRLELAGETLRAALNVLAEVAPDWLLLQVSPDWFDRYSRPVEEYRLPKGAKSRQDYAETIGRDGMKLLMTLYEDEATPEWLRQVPAVEILRQTWVHQYWVDKGKLRWRKDEDLPPAGTRLSSPYDPEARYGNKGSTAWLGYKVHLSETCEENEVHSITNVETTPAHQGDNGQTEVIHSSLEKKKLLPGEHLVDAGYVDSDLLVSSREDYGIQLIGPARPNVSWQAKMPGGYDISQFQVDWAAQKVTCPQGKQNSSWTYVVDGRGHAYFSVGFSRGDCHKCPTRSLCVRSAKGARRLSLRFPKEHQALQQRRKQQQSQEGKKRYNKRAGIEGTISQGVRGYGLRKARYWGQAKVHLQNLLTAAAMNVVRLVAWIWGVPSETTRTSRFALLAEA